MSGVGGAQRHVCSRRRRSDRPPRRAGFEGTPVASDFSAGSPRPGRVRLLRRAPGRGRDPPQTRAVTSRTARCKASNPNRRLSERFSTWERLVVAQQRVSSGCRSCAPPCRAVVTICMRRHLAASPPRHAPAVGVRLCVRLSGALGHVRDASGFPSVPFPRTQPPGAGAKGGSAVPCTTRTACRRWRVLAGISAGGGGQVWCACARSAHAPLLWQ